MATFLELEQYIMYLRKSRMDTDFEEVSMEETLSRHKKILNDFCKARKLNVVEVLEEVVSGESLSARPKMQRLLELVRTGLYAGVVCIDLERLDNYDILNPAQKNALWKLVLKKATMYRGETKGELRVKLYPNLPR